MIWTGTKNELDQFFKELNKKHPPIKFDYKASKDRIVFIGTEIYLHNGKLHTKIYRKETDRQHYLHMKSEHPKPLKDSLPYIQAIRIKRINSNQVRLINSPTEVKNNFVKQVYHPSLIYEHLKGSVYLTESNLLRKKTHDKNQTEYLS